MALEVQVTFDTTDPGLVAEFWAAALGYRLASPPAGFDTWDAALDAWGVPADQRNNASAVSDPDGKGPRLFFQKVPEGKQIKNRIHLDVRAAPGLEGDDRWTALESEANRLTALGASVLGRAEADSINKGHIVMADPEGNEFCLD
jgi:hypothetical protein